MSLGRQQFPGTLSCAYHGWTYDLPTGRLVAAITASVSMPGVLRITYPKFIHYEFYVPVDAGRHRYVGVMVNCRDGLSALAFYAKYLTWIRWLFHGQFSAQDAWMVEATDAPPERLYRPDLSLTAWRALAEREYAAKLAAASRSPQ